MRLSLVTYTYNDHEFVRELLRYAPSFGVPFFETIVVDDASDEPFADPEYAAPGLTVLRMERNIGPGQAKRVGMGRAGGDVILSIDADTRPSPQWLKAALPLLSDPKVGLVGVTDLPALADNYLSRALNKMAARRRGNTDVPFIGAGVWLLRRETWEKIGGLDDFTGTTHEDVWLCRKLKDAGYVIIAADTYPTYGKRRIHRTAYARRYARYLAPSILWGLSERREEALGKVASFFAEPLAYARKSGELAILYMELLRAIVLLTEAVKLGGKQGRTDLPSGASVLGGMVAALAGYPRVVEQLARDMRHFGVAVSREDIPWPDAGKAVRPLLESGLLPRLDDEWMAKIAAEDGEKGKFDFYYMEGAVTGGGKAEGGSSGA